MVVKRIKEYCVTNFITDKSVLEFLVSLANQITEAYRRYNDYFIVSLIFEQWVLFSQVLLPYYNTFQYYDTLKQINVFRIFKKQEISFFQSKYYALLFLLRANFKHINQVPKYYYKKFYDRDFLILIPENNEKKKALLIVGKTVLINSRGRLPMKLKAYLLSSLPNFFFMGSQKFLAKYFLIFGTRL